MIGVDTNVLVRYLAQDDPQQSALATRFIDAELSSDQPGFISLVVLVELCWVLKRLYAASRDELVATVQDLLGTARFQVDQRDVVVAALQQLRSVNRSKTDLADALIMQLAVAAGCSHTVSFDKTAARTTGMRLLRKLP